LTAGGDKYVGPFMIYFDKVSIGKPSPIAVISAIVTPVLNRPPLHSFIVSAKIDNQQAQYFLEIYRPNEIDIQDQLVD
jgi:hypothetical protein